MPTDKLAAVILSQALVTIFGLLVAYIKLKQEIQKTRHEKVYQLRLDSSGGS